MIILLILLLALFLAHVFVMHGMGLSVYGAILAVGLIWLAIPCIWLGMAMFFGLTLRSPF
jgi:hypothetical protein